MEINFRPYQSQSLDSLRLGFKDGHARQVLAASTGSGKSIIALGMIESAKNKGSRVMFVCDRRVLVDQFSRHLDRHGIDHGVFMAGHWRYRPSEKIQVASIQTLEKMQEWPLVDLIIVDEIHAVMRKSLKRFMDNNPARKVLGLTATPYQPDLPSYFSNVVNVITMKELVSNKYLVPFRVFIAKEIDTTGVKITGGEWQKDELEQRGLQVVGDVVSDYIKISQSVFGGYKKTICFSSGVAHGIALARQFEENGLKFIPISYLDDEDFKKDVLEEFAKPDTDINGIISSEILTRGFDQTDVEHVIVAKPLRKSFSMHVQIVGRGARPHQGKDFCIASGQKVLTHRGLVPIEKVSIDDTLWDGQSFVSHGGVVSKGLKHVITYAGLTATPDHRVKTKEGWRAFGECAAKQIPIVQTGLGGVEIRESENHFSRGYVERGEVEASHSCSVRVHDMLLDIHHLFGQLAERCYWWLPKMWSTKNSNSTRCSCSGGCTEAAVREPKEHTICGLRRQRNSVQVQDSIGRLHVDYGESLSTIGKHEGVATGQNQQRWSLRTWKSSLVKSVIQSFSYYSTKVKRKIARIQAGEQGHTLCGSNLEASLQFRSDERANPGEIFQAELQAKRQVWDILNSGPRNCFTCEGLLVHNCVIQDNSGNWLRFLEDWEQLYEEGTKDLGQNKDDKPRKEPTEKEKKEAKCPACGALWPRGSDTCAHCGHVRERKSMVQSVPGEMQELGAMSREDKQSWWSMAQYKVQTGSWSDKRALANYREKFGVWPRGLHDRPLPPSREFEAFAIKSIRKYLKGKR